MTWQTETVSKRKNRGYHIIATGAISKNEGNSVVVLTTGFQCPR